MRRGICFRSRMNSQTSRIIRKYFFFSNFLYYSEWDRFAKTEYERLAMEEEQNEDSEVLDAMDGWDSEEEEKNKEGASEGAAEGAK